MGRTFVTNPFDELRLTEADAEQLKQLSQSLVLENLANYEALLRGGGKLDEQRWKYHSHVEDMHAYGERTQSELDKVARKTNGKKLVASELPMVATLGTLAGTLDDVMFGLLNTTLDAMRLKTSYIDDAHGAAILARLVDPTVERPFDAVHLKWLELDMPLSAASIIHNRDWVYLEATGFATLSNGERVGYDLLHSVHFPVTVELPSRVRGRFAMCLMFRQSAPNSVENYSIGTFEAGGELPRFMQVALGAKALLSASQYAYFGQMKKLSWMLERAQIERRVDGVKRPIGSGLKDSPCVTCGKKPSRIGFSWANCRLCSHDLCFSCKVTKKMNFITPDGQLTKRKVPFCAMCISAVTRSNATEAACHQIAATSIILQTSSFSDTSSELSSALHAGNDASFSAAQTPSAR